MAGVEASMVFVDAATGEESIELVNDSPGNSSADSNVQQVTDALKDLKVERQDIVQAEVLPTKTKGGLFYSTQDGIDEGKSRVKSKPRIDEQIQGSMASFSELLQNPEFDPLHQVGKEVQGLLAGAIQHANQSSTSLSSANEILETSLAVYREACQSVADKFELSTTSTSTLAEYKRCERERQELLKKASVQGADAKREEGLRHLEESIESAKKDTARVMGRQRKEEQAQVLNRFKAQKQDLEMLVHNELQELHDSSENCESDITKIENSLECLGKSADSAFVRYTETDKELLMRLQENRAEQEELKRKLAQLQSQETALADERDTRNKMQDKAEQTAGRAQEELSKWKGQIKELYGCCQAALAVMWQFQEGSSKLIDCSVASKIEEEQRLQEMDIMAERSLRDALAAASVDAQQNLDVCNQNIEMLKKRIKEKKDERTQASRQGLGIFVEELTQELRKYKDSYDHFQQQRAQSEDKLKTYKEQMERADERLQALGEELESFDDIYAKFQKEKNAIWEASDDSSLNSLEDF